MLVTLDRAGVRSAQKTTRAISSPICKICRSAVKKAIGEGKNYADAEKEIKLPKYEKWGGYEAFLPMNIERYYDYINRGI